MSVLKRRIEVSDKEAKLWLNVSIAVGMVAAGQIAGAYPSVRPIVILLYLGAIAYLSAPAAKACAENAQSHYKMSKGLTPWIPLLIPTGLSLFLFFVGLFIGQVGGSNG